MRCRVCDKIVFSNNSVESFIAGKVKVYHKECFNKAVRGYDAVSTAGK